MLKPRPSLSSFVCLFVCLFVYLLGNVSLIKPEGKNQDQIIKLCLFDFRWRTRSEYVWNMETLVGAQTAARPNLLICGKWIKMMTSFKDFPSRKCPANPAMKETRKGSTGQATAGRRVLWNWRKTQLLGVNNKCLQRRRQQVSPTTSAFTR